MSAFDELREAATDPEMAARAHKAAGGHVIAFLCDNVPVELIMAGSALPHRIHGRPRVRSGASERIVDRLYPPDVTQRPDFVSSMLDMVLDGQAAFADALIIPHNRNAVQAIHRELSDAASNDGLLVPETWYLDKAWSPGEPALRYNMEAVAGLTRRIENFTGRSITSDALRDAIETMNAARSLVAKVNRLRGTRVRGSEAHAIISAFWSLPGKRFIELARAALEEVEGSISGPRIYLGGSPADHTELYEIVESAGGNVVTEDHCWGARAADGILPTNVDPFEAIGARFHSSPACSIRFPLQNTIDANVARATEAAADAAIFSVAERDLVQSWETPEQVAAFERAGLPTLLLRRQPYLASSETQAAISEFVGGLSQ